MEHTITANGIRQGRSSGLVLSQLQVGLAAGCAIVACLTAFGGGVIVGMWYKASEQIAPLSAAVSTAVPEKAPPSPDAAGPTPAEQPVTFYNTLTGNQAAYAPLTPQPVTPPPPAPPVAAVTPPATAVQPPGTVALTPLREGTASSAKVVPPPPSKAIAVPVTTATKAEMVALAARAAAASAAQKTAKVPPTPKAAAPTATAAGAKTTAGAPAAAPKLAARQRQPVAETTARRPAPAAPPAASKATKSEDYSVQVGSFGNSDQAERLRTNLAQKGYPVRVQLSEVPGQGLRYRVRVGSYADRAAADQSAHHLTAQEQVQAIVAGKN